MTWIGIVFAIGLVAWLIVATRRAYRESREDDEHEASERPQDRT